MSQTSHDTTEVSDEQLAGPRALLVAVIGGLIVWAIVGVALGIWVVR